MSDQETTTPDTPYRRPHLYEGMSLVGAFDRAFTKPMHGVVNMIKPNTVVVTFHTMDRGPVVYPLCRHRDDPYLVDHPDWIGVPGHAIFDISEGEKDRVAMCETVKKMVPLIEQQAQSIAELQAAMEALRLGQPVANSPASTETPVRRQRGRPRRTEPQAV